MEGVVGVGVAIEVAAVAMVSEVLSLVAAR